MLKIKGDLAYRKELLLALAFAHLITISTSAMYPVRYYSDGLFSDAAGSEPNKPARVDHVIYGNFKEHCFGSPSYVVRSNEQYSIYGSVPNTWVAPSQYTNDDGYPQSRYLASLCSFSISAPTGWKLRVKFQDRHCSRQWPRKTFVKVYNGGSTGFPEISVPEANKCSAEFVSTSRKVSVSMRSPNEPTPNYNFTLSVTVTPRSKQSSARPSYRSSYAAFISVAVFVAIVIILTRVFCRRQNYCTCCPCCVSPHNRHAVQQVYAVSNQSHYVPYAPHRGSDNNSASRNHGGQRIPTISNNGRLAYYKPPDEFDQPPPPYSYPHYSTMPPSSGGLSGATTSAANVPYPLHPQQQQQQLPPLPAGARTSTSATATAADDRPEPPSYEQSVSGSSDQQVAVNSDSNENNVVTNSVLRH